jgi:vacuolar-type H+-ATPase subunit E/Vma4
MEGINNIIENILTEARNTADEILASAKTRAEEITSEYTERAAAEVSVLSEARGEELEALHTRLSTAFEADGERLILREKRVVLDEAYSYAEKALSKLPKDEYLALLTRLAVSAAVTGDEILFLNQTDLDSLGGKLIENANAALSAAGTLPGLTLSPVAVPIDGGLLVSSPDGQVTVNCSLASLLAENRERTESAAAQILFEK